MPEHKPTEAQLTFMANMIRQTAANGQENLHVTQARQLWFFVEGVVRKAASEKMKGMAAATADLCLSQRRIQITAFTDTDAPEALYAKASEAERVRDKILLIPVE